MAGEKIESIWAFVVLDEDGEGGEGVPAEQLGDMWIPLMGADPERIASFTPWAEHLATTIGKTIELRRYTTATVMRRIEP